jgi:aspartate carbamoyltransferase catalytic subunit
MQHLITTSDFSNDEIYELFEDSKLFLDLQTNSLLNRKLIVTLFFENSTRTRSSFEIAAKRLGAEVVNLEVQTSSTKKGETVEDTVSNLNAMNPDAIIIRHSQSGLPASMIEHVSCPVINAGDGQNAHPTQALLDLFTIYDHFHGDIQKKKLALVGDIKTSRVASSNLALLPRFDIETILVAPEHFMPSNSTNKKVTFLHEVIDDMDIVISLRTQLERHKTRFYKSLEEYGKDYCITKELVGNRDILLMHPGPVNRNIDISDEMLLDKRCKVLEQVRNGVAVRMAILKKLILNNNGK